MSILNQANDGRHSELIVLFRAIAHFGPTKAEELLQNCSANSDSPHSRGALSRWTELGLFVEKDGVVTLTPSISRKRGESIDVLTNRLPSYCRRFILETIHCLPLWPEGGREPSEDRTGRTADFARGMAWILGQDIYTFQSSYAEVETLDRQQITGKKFIFLNDTRWNGFRFWARYLGFASGDDRTFLIDPTVAIRGELQSIFENSTEIPAEAFLKELSNRLPVLDRGIYRKEVEAILDERKWRRPPEGHLSMSLSLALRRLQLDNTIALDSKADAGQSVALTGKGFRTWSRFTHVRFLGNEK